jgi:hypothetical protein
MTKRYPLRGAFGGGNSGDPSHFQRIAFGIFQAAHSANHPWRHAQKGLGNRGACGDGLRGNVHHAYFATLRVMGQFCHVVCLEYVGAGQNGNFLSGSDVRAVSGYQEKAIGMGERGDIAGALPG